MLIDDNEIDNFINQKMIEGCGFAENVYVHSSARSALEFLKNLEKTGNSGINMIPEVIFLDINMPIMDGFQFLEEFKKFREPIRKRAKIAILTTSMNPTDRFKSLRNEFVISFINKPLSKDTLDKL